MVSNKHAHATDSAVRRAAGGGRRALTRGPGPFGGLGRAVVRHPWLTILAWVVVAVGVIATSPDLPTTSNESSFLPKSYESIRAADLQDKAFPEAGHVTAAAAIIVFSRADGGKLTAADSAKIRSVHCAGPVIVTARSTTTVRETALMCTAPWSGSRPARFQATAPRQPRQASVDCNRPSVWLSLAVASMTSRAAHPTSPNSSSGPTTEMAA